MIDLRPFGISSRKRRKNISWVFIYEFDASTPSGILRYSPVSALCATEFLTGRNNIFRRLHQNDGKNSRYLSKPPEGLEPSTC